MKKKKTILIMTFSIIITLIVVGALVFFLKIIKNKNQHIYAVTTTLEEKLEEKENATILAEKLSEIEVLQNLINNRFVDSGKIDTFVSYLEDIDLDTGADLSVKSIEVSPKVKNLISFRVLISGNFQEVMKTITLLENIPYEVDIVQVYLNKDLIQSSSEESNKISTPVMPNWQADVVFNILSSS